MVVSLRMLIISHEARARPSSHYKRESIPGLRTTREEMERFFDYLLLVCYLFQLSLSSHIEIPPTIVYGQPGQCADNATTDSESLSILIRERVIPSLSARCPSPGFCEGNPAESCRRIAEEAPYTRSGEYWIRSCSGAAVRVYCEMDGSRCCNKGTNSSAPGWMRVANLDMTDPSQVCPAGMFLGADTRKRLCRRKVAAGCMSIFFPTYHFPYSKVCGRVVAYQDGTADAFAQYRDDNTRTIDDDFLDGVTISVGYPRTHIWSFVISNTEGGVGADFHSSCPCARTDIPTSGVVPPFVENEYFCESGTQNDWAQPNVLYLDDPLWDGEGCPDNSACCQINNPPWFCRDLGQQFRNDLEVRLCGDENRHNEDVALDVIELYVQ